MSPIVVNYLLMRSLATRPKSSIAATPSYRDLLILPADSESLVSDGE
jgi:hypothetical protein